MLDLENLKASVADLTARVKNSTSVEAGVATLVQEIVAQNKALADKIAGMSPESITQDDLDGLQAEVKAAADALDEGTTQLAQAAAFDPNAPGDGSGQLRGMSGRPTGGALGSATGGAIGQRQGVGFDPVRSGGPGQGPGANVDPALGGPKGGTAQFAGNPPGPAGSDNPNTPRRDVVEDRTGQRRQPNPQNPVPLPPEGKAKPIAGTSAEERAEAQRAAEEAEKSAAADRKLAAEQSAPKPDAKADDSRVDQY